MVLMTCLMVPGLAFSQNAGRQDSSVEKFVANLPAGYTAVEGSTIHIDTAKMCCEGVLPTALFFNRSAPYLAFSV
jgi:hypothetical protein